jgi:hypothetical protein
MDPYTLLMTNTLTCTRVYLFLIQVIIFQGNGCFYRHDDSIRFVTCYVLSKLLTIFFGFTRSNWETSMVVE